MAAVADGGAQPGGTPGRQEIASWVVDFSQPGSDFPPRGRSLFDQIFSEPKEDGGYAYHIPFPFSALRDRLLAQLRPDAAGAPPLKEVLIPLGRSLQRTAAAPEFFRFPRVVLAVDGEAAPPPGQSGHHLKDRLYLGYIEQPGILEVISYNEEAGRFEFQIVKDYRAGGAPEVVYARRAVCIACHQNTTPIFSRPLWGETNSDPGIAQLLQAEQRDYYGIPTALGIDIPAAIDAATDRANLIPLVVKLWDAGCGHSGTSAIARRCRGTALGFALQFRLTGSLAFTTGANTNWQWLNSALTTAAMSNWPGGLLISSPDIPNRLPVVTETPAAVSGARIPGHGDGQNPGNNRLLQQMHIPALQEPLQPRPPLEKVDAPEVAHRLVTGLASFLAEIDLEQLDQSLFQLGLQQGKSDSYTSQCRFSPRKRDDGSYRISLRCAPDADTDQGGFALRGRLYLINGTITRGVIDQLTLPGEGAPSTGLEVSSARMQENPGGLREIRLSLARGTQHARLSSGNAIAEIRISWPWDATAGISAPFPQLTGIPAALNVLQDFVLLEQALRDLSTSADAKDDLLSGQPFRRRLLLRTLFPRLGIQLADCCAEDQEYPPIRVDDADRLTATGKVEPTAIQGPERGFYRFCSRCHLTRERFPPNFLFGDTAQVQANLEHCAERLYVRLGMWSLPPGERLKTPMPPVHALSMLQLDEAGWRDSPELAGLAAYIGNRLQQQTGREPRLGDLLRRGYENLRGCLAENLAGTTQERATPGLTATHLEGQ